MRPVYQEGDLCWAACVATLLGLDLGDVEDADPDAPGCLYCRTRGWLERARSLTLVAERLDPTRLVRGGAWVPGGGPLLIAGLPARGRFRPHAVLIQERRGELVAVHDPAADGSGPLDGEEPADLLVAVVPVEERGPFHLHRCPWCRSTGGWAVALGLEQFAVR
jgi:hypothetical protein